MQKPIFPIEIPAFNTNLTLVKFLYSDDKYHDLCGQMANLVAESGDNKGQLSPTCRGVPPCAPVINTDMMHLRAHTGERPYD